MKLLRKGYLLEQYRQGVLHLETYNLTAIAMPARALDTTPQFAKRRSNVSSVLGNIIHATTSALPARQLESPAPIPLSKDRKSVV